MVHKIVYVVHKSLTGKLSGIWWKFWRYLARGKAKKRSVGWLMMAVESFRLREASLTKSVPFSLQPGEQSLYSKWWWKHAATQIGNLKPMVLESNPRFWASCWSGRWRSSKRKPSRSSVWACWSSVYKVHSHISQDQSTKGTAKHSPISPMMFWSACSFAWMLKICFGQSSWLLVSLLRSLR